MRRQVQRLILNSMRPHSFEDLIFIQTVKAFDVLPQDIGVTRPV